MGAQTVLFSRRYRAALLDYLLGNGETGLSRAYDLGRTAVDNGLGPLHVLRAHQKAINEVLESTQAVNESLRSLNAAENFLMESMSPFEMTHRAYIASLRGGGSKRPARRSNRTEQTSRKR
jgi:Phosphoserine phosphatase RsbU, N-terminal domain